MRKTKIPALAAAAIILILGFSAGAFAQLEFHDPDPLNSDLKAASSLIQMGEFARAKVLLDRLRESYGDDPRLNEMYKRVYRDAKLYPELEKLVLRELAKDPQNPMLLSQLGEARYLQGDEAGADSVWNAAINTAGKNEIVYRFMADARLRYGLYEDAIDTYLTGRRNLGIPTLFSVELANIYETQSDYPRAVDEYIVQLAEMPDRIIFVSTKIRGLMEDAPDPELIIKTIDARIKESPGKAELYEILGDLYIKQGRMEKALECYKTIGSKQHDDGQSLVRFAIRAYDSKAYSTAISAIDEYIRTSKNVVIKEMALLIKAKSLSASGQPDPALTIFLPLAADAADYRIKDEAALTAGMIFALDKSDCDSALLSWGALLGSSRDPLAQNRARVEMSVCHIKKGEMDKAENLLKTASLSREAGANMERALFLLGDLALYQGDIKVAGEKYKQMVKQYPQGAFSNDALMRLGVIAAAGDDSSNRKYLDRFALGFKAALLGEDLEAAIILSDSSLASSPVAEQAAFYSAAAYARSGKRDNAIAGYRNYTEKYPEGLYIDRAYLELGDIYCLDPLTYPEAKSAYKKILESFPDGPVTELARQRLQLLETPGKIG